MPSPLRTAPLLPLVLLVLAASAFAADEPLLRIYDVGFITAGRTDHPGRSLAGGPLSDTLEGMFATESESVRFQTPETLLEIIKTNFFEDSWADSRHSIAFEGGMLIVVNRAEVHETIEKYLAVLRTLAGRQIRVEATLLDLSAASLGLLAGTEEGTVLDDRTRAALEAALADPAEARIVQSARVVAFSGQRVHAHGGEADTIVRDYDIEIAEKAAISDPIPAVVEHGCMFDVRPFVESGGRRATLHLRFQWLTAGNQPEPFDARASSLGRLHLPAGQDMGVKTALTLPLDALAVAGTVSLEERDGSRRALVLLVRASLADAVAAESPAPPTSAEKRQFRLYDIGFLVQSIPDFPGPELGFPRVIEEGVSAAFAEPDVPPGLVISTDALVDLVHRNVAASSWSNERNRVLVVSDHQIGVVQTPEVHEQIQAYLDALAKDRGRVVRVDLLCLSLSGKRKGTGLVPAFDAGTAVPDETLAALREEAKSAKDVRILGEASVAGLNRQRVHVRRTFGSSYVRDYDVEIANDSRAYDPIVGQLWEGLVCDVRSTLTGESSGVLLELHPQWLRTPEAPAVFDFQSPAGARIHLPRADGVGAPVEISVRVGQWRVASAVGDATGSAQRLLLVRARVGSVK